jgi:hypothetical protein
MEGPEAFTPAEIEEASLSDVILEKRLSHPAGREYLANICGHCDAFIGNFYIDNIISASIDLDEMNKHWVSSRKPTEKKQKKPKATTEKTEKNSNQPTRGWSSLSQEEQKQLQEFNKKIQKLSHLSVASNEGSSAVPYGPW